MTLRIPGSSHPSHVLSIEGEQGSGKTFLAAEETPRKVAIFSTDARYRDVIKPFKGYPDGFLAGEYMPPVDMAADLLFRDTDRNSQERELAERAADRQSEQIKAIAWTPFLNDFNGALADPSVRTLVMDQADEFNEILRLVNFGKLEKNPQQNYGPVNQEFKGLLKRARVAQKNLILIHQMTDQYKTIQDPVTGRDKSVSTGMRQRRWNKHAGYLIDSFVRVSYKKEREKPGPYALEILQAKLNPMVDGMVIATPSWPRLMELLAPDIPAEAWE